MENTEFLMESERKTRKWWLALLCVGLLMNGLVIFGLLGKKMPTPGIETSFSFRIFIFGVSVAFYYLYYVLCYQKSTTFLLTFSLVAFWFGIVANIVFWMQGLLPIDLFFCVASIVGILNYIVSLKLRRLNKSLNGYANFPEDSKEAASLFESALSKEELQNLFAEGLKKWPHLKWVLRREKKIKEESFRSGDCGEPRSSKQ